MEDIKEPTTWVCIFKEATNLLLKSLQLLMIIKILQGFLLSRRKPFQSIMNSLTNKLLSN